MFDLLGSVSAGRRGSFVVSFRIPWVYQALGSRSWTPGSIPREAKFGLGYGCEHFFIVVLSIKIEFPVQCS